MQTEKKPETKHNELVNQIVFDNLNHFYNRKLYLIQRYP